MRQLVLGFARTLLVLSTLLLLAHAVHARFARVSADPNGIVVEIVRICENGAEFGWFLEYDSEVPSTLELWQSGTPSLNRTIEAYLAGELLASQSFVAERIAPTAVDTPLPPGDRYEEGLILTGGAPSRYEMFYAKTDIIAGDAEYVEGNLPTGEGVGNVFLFWAGEGVYPETDIAFDVGWPMTRTVSDLRDYDPGSNPAGCPIPADLSLTKSVDNATPTVGNTVTFTLRLDNAGPSPATGVQVLDELPNGYSYVSSSGDGSYNSNTGIWAIDQVLPGTPARLDIEAIANLSGRYDHVAQVIAADWPDPDSQPDNDDGSQSEDDEASVTTTPTYAGTWARIYLPLLSKSNENQPPFLPADPFPHDGGTDEPVDAGLSWTGGDPDGDAITYDVYLEAGDRTPDRLVCEDTVSPACEPGTVSHGQRYYWQVVARDQAGVTATGPVWSFVTQDLPGWQEMGERSASGGGVSNDRDGSWNPSLVIAADGTSYLAWGDSELDVFDEYWLSEVQVRRWDGSTWTALGVPMFVAEGSALPMWRPKPSLAVAPDGTPYVAWGTGDDQYAEIYVQRWDGSAWTQVGAGPDSDTTGGSWSPSLAIAPDATPYVAWQDNSNGNGEIYVRRWDGSNWQEVGPGSASGGGISNNAGTSSNPSLAIAPDGTPYLAWNDDSSGNNEIYVRRWNGSSWEEVGTSSAGSGGISANSGSSTDPSVAIAPDGTAYVSWTDDSSGNSEIYVRRGNGSVWEAVGTGSASGGGISNNSGASQFPSLAFALDGTPYVAWDDDSDGDREIYILHWYGDNWEEFGFGSARDGGVSDNRFGSHAPSAAVTPDGTPIVAWSDHSGGDSEIYLKRWDAVTDPPSLAPGWYQVGPGSAHGGGISNNSNLSALASLAIAPSDIPFVAWADFSSGHFEIYVRGWNGSTWAEVGPGSASGGGISNSSGTSQVPSLAIAPDGTPYVAWADDSSGNSEIYVRRWNGSVWAEVGANSASGGGISNDSGASTYPSMAIAPDGRPYVAWLGGSQVYIRRWNGSVWEEVGAGSASGDGISNSSGEIEGLSLAIASDGAPYVAWDSLSEIYVRRWNGSAWADVGPGPTSGGSISDNNGTSEVPSLAVALDGTPYVAWWDNSSGNSEIYIRRWNGSIWEEVGAGSARGGGISNTGGASMLPSLAVVSDGTPYAAWYDDSSGNNEIYVRRWNGSIWEEVGPGSAGGGGISNNGGWSSVPSLAIASDGTPYVAWNDNSSLDLEIYVRRWEQ